MGTPLAESNIPFIVAEGIAKSYTSERPFGKLRRRLRTTDVRRDLVGLDYEDSRAALIDVSFEVAPGTVLSIVGHSGAGKSTLLKIIAGLLLQSGGSLYFGNVESSNLAPFSRPIGYVPQSYALPRHLTVRQIVEMPLSSASGLSKSKIDSLVKWSIEVVDLCGLAQKKPEQLSGGQRQRAALARSFVRVKYLHSLGKQSAILLDEPFSSLDEELRRSLMNELLVLKSMGITTLYVTHDLHDAFEIGDKIILLANGRVLQEGTPSQLYEFPNSLMVTRFLGLSTVFPVTKQFKHISSRESAQMSSKDSWRQMNPPARSTPDQEIIEYNYVSPANVKIISEAAVSEFLHNQEFQVLSVRLVRQKHLGRLVLIEFESQFGTSILLERLEMLDPTIQYYLVWKKKDIVRLSS